MADTPVLWEGNGTGTPGIDYASLKRGGVMRQVEAGRFSLRLHVVAGNLDAARLRAIADVAERFGRGVVHLTARQGMEIPHVPLACLEEVRRALGEAGLSLGACGPRVRTVTGCQGAAVCPHGVVETAGLAQAIDRAFAGLELPHKLKFGVAGCRNACLKPQENDMGVMGVVEPRADRSGCDGCLVCATVCPTGAMTVGDACPEFDPGRCDQCGDCIASCPNDCLSGGRRGYALFLGGRFGRNPKLGERYGDLIPSVPALLRVMGALVELYRTRGRRGERFGVTLERMDRAEVEALIREAAS